MFVKCVSVFLVCMCVTWSCFFSLLMITACVTPSIVLEQTLAIDNVRIKLAVINPPVIMLLWAYVTFPIVQLVNL